MHLLKKEVLLGLLEAFCIDILLLGNVQGLSSHLSTFRPSDDLSVDSIPMEFPPDSPAVSSHHRTKSTENLMDTPPSEFPDDAPVGFSLRSASIEQKELPMIFPKDASLEINVHKIQESGELNDSSVPLEFPSNISEESALQQVPEEQEWKEVEDCYVFIIREMLKHSINSRNSKKAMIDKLKVSLERFNELRENSPNQQSVDSATCLSYIDSFLNTIVEQKDNLKKNEAAFTNELPAVNAPSEFPLSPAPISAGSDVYVPPMVYLSNGDVVNDTNKRKVVFEAVNRLVNETRNARVSAPAVNTYDNLSITYVKSQMNRSSNVHIISVVTTSDLDGVEEHRSDTTEPIKNVHETEAKEFIEEKLATTKESMDYLDMRTGHAILPVILVSLVTFVVSLYIGLVAWRRMLENRYGNKELLLPEEFPDGISYI